tara:strand:+ start:248 stop:772 length:525 start_codon:yes stop_codon:yes gene_type:complete
MILVKVELTSFIRAMGQVLVHRPRLALGAANWDTSGSSIIQKSITTRETLVKLWHSPWSNNLDLWLQGIECQLESDLIVTLSSTSVADREAVLLLGDGDLSAGNDRTGERRAEKVDVLVDGVALHGWEAELLDELLAQILNVACDGSDLHCLGLGGLEILCVSVMSVSFRGISS